jgi:hypothetical protein
MSFRLLHELKRKRLLEEGNLGRDKTVLARDKHAGTVQPAFQVLPIRAAAAQLTPIASENPGLARCVPKLQLPGLEGFNGIFPNKTLVNRNGTHSRDDGDETEEASIKTPSKATGPGTGSRGGRGMWRSAIVRHEDVVV